MHASARLAQLCVTYMAGPGAWGGVACDRYVGCTLWFHAGRQMWCRICLAAQNSQHLAALMVSGLIQCVDGTVVTAALV